MTNLSRRDEALVALASMPNGQATPVQAIKMRCLMEKKAAAAIGGAKFSFVPYDYGPFDHGVYVELDGLAREGHVAIVEGKPRRYLLTPKGNEEAAQVLARLDGTVADYFARLGRWIASMTFTQLVSAIYQEYPEMRANSIFRG